KATINAAITNPIAGIPSAKGAKAPQQVSTMHNAPHPAAIWNSGVTRRPVNPAPASKSTAPIAQVIKTEKTSGKCGRYGATVSLTPSREWSFGHRHASSEHRFDREIG